MKITHRIAAVLLLLFCIGHTVGTIAGRSPAPEAEPALRAMRAVHFDFHGVDRTFYGLFVGHALLVSVYLAASALLAWKLSNVEAARWHTIATAAWGLAIAQIATAVVAWLYFFPGPALLTSAAAVLLLAGNASAVRKQRLATSS
jgi:hypothetical protein